MHKQISVRFDTNLIDELRRAARKRAFVNDQPVTWLQLLDEAARRLLRDETGSADERIPERV